MYIFPFSGDASAGTLLSQPAACSVDTTLLSALAAPLATLAARRASFDRAKLCTEFGLITLSSRSLMQMFRQRVLSFLLRHLLIADHTETVEQNLVLLVHVIKSFVIALKYISNICITNQCIQIYSTSTYLSYLCIIFIYLKTFMLLSFLYQLLVLFKVSLTPPSA